MAGTQILMVDDSRDDSLLTVAQLRRHIPDIRFRRVDTAETMRQALAAQDWDLILCDESMPAFNSADALGVLKASGKAIPLLIYSGHFTQAKWAAAALAGARAFVDKNRTEELASTVLAEIQAARRPARAHVAPMGSVAV